MNYETRKADRADLEMIVRRFPAARPLLCIPEQAVQVAVSTTGNFVGVIVGFYCSNLTMAASGLDHEAVMALAEPLSFEKITNIHIPVIFVEASHRDTKAFPLLFDGFKRLLQSLVESGARLGYVTAAPGNVEETTVFMALGLEPYGDGTFLATDAQDFIDIRA